MQGDWVYYSEVRDQPPVLGAAQLAFSMVPSSAATCEQLFDACARALEQNQASIASPGQQAAAYEPWMSTQQARSFTGLLHLKNPS